MSVNLIVGNIFSLLSIVCVGISVIKKNKKDLIYWQVVGAVFCIFASVFLLAYASVVMNLLTLSRNILAYLKKLTKNLTLIFCIVSAIIGLYINNIGIFGIFPIAATMSYTFFLFATKDEQQMRWAVILNLLLWCVHDFYVQAYPAALADIGISIWTAIQIFKNRKKHLITAHHPDKT